MDLEPKRSRQSGSGDREKDRGRGRDRDRDRGRDRDRDRDKDRNSNKDKDKDRDRKSSGRGHKRYRREDREREREARSRSKERRDAEAQAEERDMLRSEQKRLRDEEATLMSDRKARLEAWKTQRLQRETAMQAMFEAEKRVLEEAGESNALAALEEEKLRQDALRESMGMLDGDEDIRGMDDSDGEEESGGEDTGERDSTMEIGGGDGAGIGAGKGKSEATAGAEAEATMKDVVVDAIGDEDEIDPLDAYMQGVEVEVREENATWEQRHLGLSSVSHTQTSGNGATHMSKPKPKLGGAVGISQPLDLAQTEETTVDEEAALSFKTQQEEGDDALMKYKARKKSKLDGVDHSTIEYAPFRRNIYVEAPEIRDMSREAIVAAHPGLKDVKIRGKNCPKPVLKWSHCGLPLKMLDLLTKKLKFDAPTAIQAQSIPALMSGRDCIGVAKTGSGKTLAYVLPMLRHVLDQDPLEEGDGPIALIMVPTRELAAQVYKDTRPFVKAFNISMTCLYGGTQVGDQINQLKRGVEIAVCTPGRLIEVLALNKGRITNLKRVTFLVLDEADRMFDMGFEPQVTKVIENSRPDRQTLMFSATFPRTVEMLAKQGLNKPVEIIVDGRNTVCSDVYQFVEVRTEDTKFLRLLQVLGEFYERGSALIFVKRQDDTDKIYKKLRDASYPCATLHGGLDQADRESNIADFKSGDIPILVATSVAARGLHVDNLNLVVNYDAPTHLEDYVHRVGRTGRAGKKGWAYTFVAPSEAHIAPELIKALQESGSEPLDELVQLAKDFEAQKAEDEELARLSSGFKSGGYGGKGFAFSEEEADSRNLTKKLQMLDHGDAETKESFSEDLSRALITYQDSQKARVEAEAERRMKAIQEHREKVKAKGKGKGRGKAEEEAKVPGVLPEVAKAQAMAASISRVLTGAAGGAGGSVASAAKEVAAASGENAAAVAAALEAAKAIQAKLGLPETTSDTGGGGAGNDTREHYEDELVINDYPQQARWMVTRKDALNSITDFTKCAVTVRGVYVAEGAKAPEGEKPLYLLIEGTSEAMVKQTRRDIKKMIDSETGIVLQKTANPFQHTTGRYSVL